VTRAAPRVAQTCDIRRHNLSSPPNPGHPPSLPQHPPVRNSHCKTPLSVYGMNYYLCTLPKLLCLKLGGRPRYTCLRDINFMTLMLMSSVRKCVHVLSGSDLTPTHTAQCAWHMHMAHAHGTCTWHMHMAHALPRKYITPTSKSRKHVKMSLCHVLLGHEHKARSRNILVMSSRIEECSKVCDQTDVSHDRQLSHVLPLCSEPLCMFRIVRPQRDDPLPTCIHVTCGEERVSLYPKCWRDNYVQID
jgi:hypothetical protein